MRRIKPDEEFKIKDSEEAKLLFSDICNGRSCISIGEKGENFYWKHCTNEITSKLVLRRLEYIDVANKEGVKTEEKKIKDLIKAEAWTEKEEEEVKEVRNSLSWSYGQLNKLVLKEQQKMCLENIGKEQKKLAEVSELRNELLGLTAEGYADDQLKKDFIRLQIFKDEECTEPLHADEDIRELPVEALQPWVRLVDYERMWFSDENFKKVAVWPFFMNGFFLAGENISEFFRKPMVDLTIYQSDLLNAGSFVKNVLTNQPKQPNLDLYEDLDKLINWYTLQSARIKSGRKQGESKEGTKMRHRIG